MFPLVAIGAALIGAFAVAGIQSDSKSQRRDTKDADPQQVAMPQSYVVTPIGGSGGGRQATALEAVRNFIV